MQYKINRRYTTVEKIVVAVLLFLCAATVAFVLGLLFRFVF